MGRAALAAGIFSALLIAAPAARAQEPADEYENADRYDLDLFGPTGPALVSLDVTARRASAPATPNDFDFDSGDSKFPGSNRIGVSASFSPYWIGERRVTLSEYRSETGAFERMFARSQVSAGLARIANDDIHAWRFGAAAQTQLLDAQDHRYDREAYECLHAAWNRTQRRQHESLAQQLAEAFAEDEEADLGVIQEEGLDAIDSSDFETARDRCSDESAWRLLAKPSWLAGAGVGWRSDPNEFSGFDYDGASLWTNYRQPLTPTGRFAVFGLARVDLDRRIDLDELVLAPKGDSIEVGGGGAIQNPRFRLDLAATYNRNRFNGVLTRDDFMRYTATADIRIREGLWVEGSIGVNEGSRFNDGFFGGAKLIVSWSDYSPF